MPISNRPLRNTNEYGDEWYLNFVLHREDGPAVERVDGYTAWWIHGEKHRINGPAVIDEEGTKYWYRRGQFHRIDGPAIESVDGYKEWWLDGRRLDPIVHFLKVGELAHE